MILELSYLYLCTFLLCEVHSQLYSVVPDAVYEFQDKCHYLSKMKGFYFSLWDGVSMLDSWFVTLFRLIVLFSS